MLCALKDNPSSISAAAVRFFPVAIGNTDDSYRTSYGHALRAEY